MKTVYIAGWYEARSVARELRDALAAVNVRAVGRWMDGSHDGVPGETDYRDMTRFCAEDLNDLTLASTVVVLKPRAHFGKGRGGHHTEIGYALGTGRRVILVGEPENVFHYHPLVTVVSWALDDVIPVSAIVVALGGERT